MRTQDEKTYYALRDEIRYNQNQENVISMFTYTACIAILTFSFGAGSEVGAALAQAALIPFAYKVGRFRDSIAYLASYLCVVLEPKINGSWERDNKTYRTEYPYLKRVMVKISRGDFLILSCICVISSWTIYYNRLIAENDSIKNLIDVFLTDKTYSIILLLFQIAGLVLVGLFTFVYCDIDKMKAKKIHNWELLHDSNKLIP